MPHTGTRALPRPRSTQPTAGHRPMKIIWAAVVQLMGALALMIGAGLLVGVGALDWQGFDPAFAMDTDTAARSHDRAIVCSIAAALAVLCSAVWLRYLIRTARCRH